MSHADLTVLINTMDEQQVESLLELFANEELTVSRPPRTGLVMLTVKDCFETDFHLGEVLVTEARVVFRGCEGYGMIPGEAPRRALARAAADAVLRCSEPTGIQKDLRAFLEREEAIRETRLAEEAALVAATKVNFDLMPGA
ncbi:phosphonate C-P lyase system protein PhnG [Desulfatirhabdium butyrativorans]|uniref:phosphonate C-P lyase system protein PhnG n=1 Tax=Desulfatirhabdium butyrativorans TaxID=340467 RepID=UPI0004277FFB|nr:phosphonate C-P lyase system protein PhnG [Desulfatirhabdium butyrativorans]